MSNDKLLENLNEEQKDAVKKNDGPLLIFAGAGTGKTLAITTKIAHLLNNNICEVKNILAVTFTNKAAKEMKDRIKKLIKDKNINGLYIGTFHKICCKIIRIYSSLCGLKENFSIIDKKDQLNILKEEIVPQIKFSGQFLIKFEIDNKKGNINYKYIAEMFLEDINKVKCEMIKFNEVKTENFSIVFEMYKNYIQKHNLLDFNDLILKCIKLLEENPNIKKYYNELFKFILVDEYQDTNEIQNKWIKLISGFDENKNKCITCVGDDDQSIYSWRGAKVEKILKLSNEIKNLVIFDKNYRSTQNILNISNSLISHNTNRVTKNLISIKDNNDNFPVITSCNTSTGEVINIVEQIQNLYNKKLIEKYNQTAVLIRAGYQAKKIVNIFNKKHLPYIEVGIINLYQRKEIKDLIFYIKLIYNKDDNFAFKQIINIPPRGIGDKTLEKIIKNNTNNLSYFQCAEDFIKTKKNSKIANFLKFIKELNEEYIENDCTININEIQKPTIKDLLKKIIQNVNYIDFLKKKYKGEMVDSRIENINNLLNSVENQICNKENITEFLEYTSLESKEENEEKKIDNKVIISTIHKAKGLEYDYVFLPFWNNNSFPNLKTLQEKNGMEEERRLAYVAITRAKKNVYISYHIKNIFKDKIFDVYPSNFIEEISENKTNKINFVRIDDDINEERKIDIFQYLGEKRKRENNEFENNNNEFSLFSNIENDNFN